MEQSEDPEVKTPMTDAERVALAAKLDAELDEFINGLEKKQYTEGWPEDRWEEEMDKHPFFMKKAPEPGEELHPLLQGIQQLKYDPEENTAEELAVSYKDDGNFNFKHKNYRLAIMSYTEGLKQKHENVDLKASLLNNRAASHYFLKNYRSSLRDCEAALRLQPAHEKAQLRAAKSAFSVENYAKSIEYCDKILNNSPEMSEILQLRQQAVNTAKELERDVRRRQKAETKRKNEELALLQALKQRKLKFDCNKVTVEYLVPKLAELSEHRVALNEKAELIWPVVILYPEFKTMDFVQQFNEHSSIEDQLKEVLTEAASWDRDHKYTVSNVNVYFELNVKKSPELIDLNLTLAQVLTNPRYIIKAGTPSLIVIQKNSRAEQTFLNSYIK